MTNIRNSSKKCSVEIHRGGDYSTIEITRKNGDAVIAKIDNNFCDEASKYHWQYTSSGYIRTSKADGYIALHRMVYEFFNDAIQNDVGIDHINGDTMDNRASNLRICTPQDNARNTRNRPVMKNGGITGVRRDTRCKSSWRAQLYPNKSQHIGKTFRSEEMAILQRLIWELQYFGEFAPQIDLIKREYPYLMNYFQVNKNMTFSNDVALIYSIGTQLMQDPHCPCMLAKNENTLCPCLPCRTKDHCHCGMFVTKETKEGENLLFDFQSTGKSKERC